MPCSPPLTPPSQGGEKGSVVLILVAQQAPVWTGAHPTPLVLIRGGRRPNMSDQADRLRELVGTSRGRSDHGSGRGRAGRHGDGAGIGDVQDDAIAALYQWQGGVGTSNLVLNLAIALGEMGERVVVVDAILDWPTSTSCAGSRRGTIWVTCWRAVASWPTRSSRVRARSRSSQGRTRSVRAQKICWRAGASGRGIGRAGVRV